MPYDAPATADKRTQTTSLMLAHGGISWLAVVYAAELSGELIVSTRPPEA
jgi:hypothetical protein